MSNVDFDVVVAGAGVVGLSAALAMATRLSESNSDIKIALLDKNTIQPQPLDGYQSKVFAINAASKTFLETINVWPQIQQSRVQPYDSMRIWDASGTGSVEFTAAEAGVEQLGCIVEAANIQNALCQAVSRQENLSIFQQSEITDLNHLTEYSSNSEDTGIEINFVAESGQHSITTKLLCAADGASSSVRKLANFVVIEEDCEQIAIVANIGLQLPHQNCAWQIFTESGPLAFLPLKSDQDNLCSIVWSIDKNKALAMLALPEAGFLQQLQRAIEKKFGDLSLQSSVVQFPLKQQHATSYVQPNIVLLGDAAHSIHPLAGLGANLGLQDAQALTEELTRASARQVPLSHPQVLRRYQRQRYLHNQLSIQSMAFFKKHFVDINTPLNALRNAGLKAFNKSTALKTTAIQYAMML